MTNRVRVVIERSDGRGQLRCHGPVWNGLCAARPGGGQIPCAGGRILPLSGTWADGTWMEVSEGAGPACPLAGVVTVTPAPWD